MQHVMFPFSFQVHAVDTYITYIKVRLLYMWTHHSQYLFPKFKIII